MITTPLQLKALLGGLAAAVIACLMLTVWALLERTGRLDCRAESAYLDAAYRQLVRDADVQTKEVKRLEQLGAQARERGRVARGAVTKLEQELGLQPGTQQLVQALRQRLEDAQRRKIEAGSLRIPQGGLAVPGGVTLHQPAPRTGQPNAAQRGCAEALAELRADPQPWRRMAP